MESFKYEKRIILIVLLVAGAIVIPLFVLQQAFHTKQFPSPSPFPSPVVPTYYPGGQPFSKALEITSIDPDDNTTNVSVAPTITISFSRPFTGLEQQAIKLSATPAANFSTSWSSDNASVYFFPTSPLTPAQHYTFTLSFGSLTRTWSYTTKSQDAFTNEDFQNLQTISDTAYSEQQAATRKTYPWIDSLPISNSTYFTYFDFDTTSFTTHMYYAKDSALTPSQENTIKSQVTAALKNIGVDTTKYKLIWQPTPVSE